jgi:preprotein translocase subunit SecA
MNFERRKNVIAYDDIMNQQRELIYKQRRDILADGNLSETIKGMIDHYIEDAVAEATQSDVPDEWDFELLKKEFGPLIGLTDQLEFGQSELDELSRETLCDTLQELALAKYKAQEETFTPEIFREVERSLLLRNVDRNWMDYIDEADDLKGSIGLNAYAQRNPVTEYKIASSEMFDAMVRDIRAGTVRMVLSVVRREQAARKQAAVTNSSGGGIPAQNTPKKPIVTARKDKKAGPNDPCPCGSGKKFKKCCGSISTGKAE